MLQRHALPGADNVLQYRIPLRQPLAAATQSSVEYLDRELLMLVFV